MMKRERHQLSVAVFVVLRRADDICLIRRAHTGWMDGFYSLPAGGLEHGETLLQAAAREAGEETGVAISPAQLRSAHSMHVKTEDRSWLGHFFLCSDWQGEPYVAEPDKHSELRWVNIRQLPENTVPYVKQAIEAIIAGEIYSEYGW
ncbi:8-oxo-dGTP diphosphatase [Cedecea lapagei]|uniref:8-oxo-dGTP diphosphatase n=1 Tax=Cedecea lapagei TaxID=158823 RepID=A0A3S4MEW1_9ENTR|nr:NUDIX domain-containing protein [Cedecea lapagei]VEB98491.1 8-oxo-dGTP diphosphatase [Cedecea lapagei]